MSQAPLILSIFPTFGLGGQQRRWADLISAWGPTYRHKIISLTDEINAQGLLGSAANVEVDTLTLKKGGFIVPQNVEKLQDLIKSSGASLLCTNNWGTIEAILAWRMLGAGHRKIPHIHFEDGFGPDESADRQNIKRVLTRRFILRQSSVIVPSNTLHSLALVRWRLVKSRVYYVPNGIDLDRFSVSQDKKVATNDHICIGTVGAFRPEKNFPRLVRVFEKVVADYKGRVPLKLTLVGDGPEREGIKSLCHQSRCTGQINLPGATSSPETLYPGFDIFTLSSDTEQMPISLMEAMAAGLPVVATDVGDVAAMVSEENRRFIVPVKDENAFAACLSELIENPQLRTMIGQKNLSKAQHYFSRDKMVETYNRIFDKRISKS